MTDELNDHNGVEEQAGLAAGASDVIESEGQDSEFLVKIREAGYLLKIHLIEEQMECRADIEILDEEQMITPSQLLAILYQADITEHADQDAIVAFCEAAAAGNPQTGALLASGSEPVKGADGWFELAIKVAGGEAEYEEDEWGNVDLRTLNSFTGLEPGSKIGTLHAPKKGVAGETATGLPIPAEAGDPFNLLVGDGVELKYDGRLAFATKSGRALLDKEHLSVIDEFPVGGDLDLHVGNIDFNGFVEIKGDVLDDFNIKASKGILVGGVVGACSLESGGSIEIGSMAGREVGRIVCHGDLVAKFLNQVDVECHGNVIVANEIRNCNIKATGCILVENGSISGGSCVSLEGIQAAILGSPCGLKTRLKAGVYFPEVDQLEYLRNGLKDIKLQLKRVRDAIGPLEVVHTPESDEHADLVTERRLAILNQQGERLVQEKEQFVVELESWRCEDHAGMNPKVNAVKSLMEGVVITLGNSTHETKDEHTGPISVIENSRNGDLRYLDMSPLQTRAQLVEKEIRKLEAAEEREAAELAAAEGGDSTEPT